jgi:hypothetical protein
MGISLFLFVLSRGRYRAFSSEVDTGSREENASNKMMERWFWSNQNRERLQATASPLSRAQIIFPP